MLGTWGRMYFPAILYEAIQPLLFEGNGLITLGFIQMLLTWRGEKRYLFSELLHILLCDECVGRAQIAFLILEERPHKERHHPNPGQTG